jgi:hypothetical protein
MFDAAFIMNTAGGRGFQGGIPNFFNGNKGDDKKLSVGDL